MSDATATAEMFEINGNPEPVHSACEHCGTLFVPRSGSGGKPQRFCRTACKDLWHAEQRANVANVAQRAEAQTPDPMVGLGETAAEPPEPEELASYSGGIPAQDEIRIQSITSRSPLGNDVEIVQIDDQGSEDKIIVQSSNVVRFARQVLWAAGFKQISFAHSNGGGWTDIEDGDEPGRFY